MWANPTGKEEDVEVGLVYFGKRYLNTALQRWTSPDPLQIHSGGADPNLYAYVSGQALKNVDPIGLEGENASGSDAGLSDDQWNQLVQENLVAPSDLSSDGSAETWAVTPSAQAALRGEEAQPTRLEDFQDEDGVVDFEAWSEAQRTPSPAPAPAVPPNEFEKSLVNHMALSLQAPFQMMSPTPPAAPTIPFPEASTTNPFMLTLEVFTLVDSLASLPRLALSAPSTLRTAPVMDAARGAGGHGYATRIVDGGTGRAFAGHGELRFGAGTTTIPEGTSLTMWTGQGRGIADSTGRLIEAGSYSEVPFAEGAVTWLPGAQVPNYVLKAPSGLTIMRNSMTVESATPLSTLLRPNMGHLDWAACLLCR